MKLKDKYRFEYRIDKRWNRKGHQYVVFDGME